MYNPSECHSAFFTLTNGAPSVSLHAQVVKTRTEGCVVVIECAFSINLTALTLEQVLGKRRKVVSDMCQQLADKARLACEQHSALWDVLRTKDEAPGSVPHSCEAFLSHRLMALAQRDPAHYNENAPLGHAIGEAVAMADIAAGWAEGLHALAAEANCKERKAVHRLKKVGLALTALGRAEKDVAKTKAEPDRARPEALSEEAMAPKEAITLKMTAEELRRSTAPLILSFKKRQSALPLQVVHGLCALMWARPEGATLSLDLSSTLETGKKGGSTATELLGAKSLTALARALTPAMTELNLRKANCANNGGDNTGVQQLCTALCDERAGGGLTALDLADNRLDAEAGKALAQALEVNTTLRTLRLDRSELNIRQLRGTDPQATISLADQGLCVASCIVIAKLLEQNRMFLTKLNLSVSQIRVEGSRALANALKVNDALRDLDISFGELGVEGAINIAEGLAVNTRLEALTLSNNMMCGVDSTGKGTHSMEGIRALCEALNVNSTLTKLGVEYNKINREGEKLLQEVANQRQVPRLEEDGSERKLRPLKIDLGLSNVLS